MAAANQSIKKTHRLGRLFNNLPQYIFLAFLFLIPLFFLPLTFSQVALNKQLLAGVTILALFIYVLAVFLKQGQLIFVRSSLPILASAFLGTVVLATIFSSARITSVWSTSPDSLLWVGLYVITFLLALFLLNKKEWIVRSSFLLLMSISLLAIFGLLQLSGIFIFPFEFARNLNFNPVGNTFTFAFAIGGMFVALVTFLTLTQIKRRKYKSVLLWAVAGMFAVIIVQMNLWALWLAIAAALSVTVVALLYRNVILEQGLPMHQATEGRSVRYTLQKFLVPLFIIAAAIFFVIVRPDIPIFVASTTQISPSVSATSAIVKGVLAGPDFVLGSGPATFPFSYSLHKSLSINQTLFWGVQFQQGFSAFLSYLVSWGALGIIALSVFISMALKVGLQHFTKAQHEENSDTRRVRALGMASFAAFVFFSVAFIVNHADIVLMFALFASAGIAMAALRVAGAIKEMQIDAAHSPRLLVASAVLSIILLSASVAGIYSLGTRYAGAVVFGQALSAPSENRDTLKTLDELNKALRYDSTNDLFLRVSAQMLLVRLNEIVNDPDLSVKDRESLVRTTTQNAAAVARRATEINPTDVQNWIQLGSTYEQLIGLVQGVEDLAVEAYSDGAEREPTNPFLQFASARALITAGQQLDSRGQSKIARQKFELAVAKLDNALALKRDYAAARFLQVRANDLLGNIHEAIAGARQTLSTTPNDTGTLLQLGLLQYRSKDFRGAKTTLERLLTVQNNSADGRYLLGIIESALGNNNEALVLFERLSKEFPSDLQVAQIFSNLREGLPALTGVNNPLFNPVSSPSGGAEKPILP